VTAESGSPVRDVLAEGHSIDPRRQPPISTSTVEPPHRFDACVPPAA
jgi:hypothetical protein